MSCTRTCLREHLQQFGMTVDWLTESGHARIGGTPSEAYFEPLPSKLRRDPRNRISIFESIGQNRLIFPEAMLHDVRPIRVTLGSFFHSPFGAGLLFFGMVGAKLAGKWETIKKQSEIEISIVQHNRRAVAEFPFGKPLDYRGRSLTPGAFYVQDPQDAADAWQLDTLILTNVNLIEIETRKRE